MIKIIKLLALSILLATVTIMADSNTKKSIYVPYGPKQNEITIDLAQQKLFIYNRDHKLLLESKVSTGRWGHETTQGKFRVILKERKHLSNLYPKNEDGTQGGASMPYTVKFTTSGIAIHAGNVPDYPDSHGCIRVPYGKAMQIFKIVDVGSPVRVIGKTDYSDKVNQLRMTMEDEDRLSKIDEDKANFGSGYLEDSSDDYGTIKWVESSLKYLDDM